MKIRIVSCLLVLLPAAVSAGGPRIIYPDSAPPPVRQSWFGPSAVPDCAGASVLTIAAGFDTVLIDSTTNREALVDGYGCNDWDESGPEFVLGLEIAETVFLHAALASPADLDLFLLGDCESDSCLAGHISEFTALLPARPEPYWLVVDGYLGAEGAFSLELEAAGGGLDPAACGEAVPVSCGDGSEQEITGDTFDRPNHLERFDGSPVLSRGGEVWYELSLQDTVTLDVTLKDIVFDGVLWLFDACGPDAPCLARVDAGASEARERLVHKNETGATHTYYLGVDSIDPIGIAHGSNFYDGVFKLSLSCEGQIVPVRKTSFGEIKSMFR